MAAPTAGALSAHELHTLLHAWNATEVDFEPRATVHALFERQARRRPDAVAVVDATRALTYAELDARANQLAHLLLAEGVGREERVALCLERSVDTAVALLGILKAGAAYLPLEPTYPRERLAFMLEDAGARLLLTQGALLPLFALPSGLRSLLLERELAGAWERAPRTAPTLEGPEDGAQLAYVLYTSGSTGAPKGALVPHRAINRLVCAVDYVRLGEDEVLLHAAPLAFDASTFEVWGALLNGGRLVCHPERVPTPRGLRETVARHGVTTAWLTAALFNALVDEDVTCLAGLRQVLTGGEALSVPHVRRALAALPHTQLINGYGPTECTTFAVTHRIPRELPADARSVPIGRPIRDTRLYVLDAALRPVPVGAEGELYIGGAGLARGYLHRPELTRERFLDDPFRPGERMYRTGDLVRYLPDGRLDYLGRADRQVKLRGFRIELGEIESALLARPGLKSGVVVAREDTPGHKRLVAYLVARDDAERPTEAALREALGRALPEYMVPSAFVWLAALPLTDNGKLDVRALPAPERKRPGLAEAYVAPRGPLEEHVARLWAELLELDRVGAHDNFFALGGTSLLAVRAASRLAQARGVAVPAVQLFECPTPAALAAWLSRGKDADGALGDVQRRARVAGGRDGRLADVALVGLAGRFPGAPDVDAFWRNLCAGVESVSFFAPEELDPLVPRREREDPAYVRARGVLEGVDRFDAAFFGIGPREADLMDPQQRLFLETCWQALEDSGHAPDTVAGPVGVFGGVYNNGYHAKLVSRRPDLVERLGAFQVMVGNEKDYVASRVAHRLDLRGPAVSVHTACSTSLVAVCEAVKALQLGECDLALAGGASVTVPIKSGYLYQEGGMLSADGHCRPYADGATGTTFSDGVGVVVLKRLEDALADGDTVHAVIRGAAVNNDGGHKASFTAPSVEGQAAVVALAQAKAQVGPRDVSYVEGHGTATPLGDPIEVAGLTRAFRAGTDDVGFCALGSVKSNVGHLVIAAGVAGLIKTALSLEHEVLPPTLHFERPNPKIDFTSTPFVVNTRLTPWPRTDKPRFAGVSSFGVGGTNAHVVLEEPPRRATSGPARPQHVLLLSARSRAALDAMSARLAAHLAARPDLPLADVAFTLSTGRSAFAHRRTVVAATAAEAARALEAGAAPRVATAHCETRDPEVAFLFPGQGAQYPDMGRALYEREPVFRDAVDTCAERLAPHLGQDLRALLYPAPGDAEAAAAALRETALTQPALFVTGWATARWWMSLGVTPGALAGHSVGELVAAALAGVLSLEDALRLVAVRGQLMGAQPRGSMLSVRLPAAEVEARLAASFPSLCVASDNAPGLCVVAGPTPDADRLAAALTQESVACRALQTSHAFHSAMMDAAVAPFAEVVRSVQLGAPRIPIVSTATGTWLTDAQAQDPDYWARHLRAPVRFREAAATLLERDGRVLLETGPRNTLTTLVRQQVRDRARTPTVASLGDAPGEAAEYAALLGAAGQLWLAGMHLDWRAFWAGERRHRVRLPTYPFERQRHWVDVTEPPSAEPAPARTPTAARALVARQLELMQQQLALLQARRPTRRNDGA